jgi:hypothetical protein
LRDLPHVRPWPRADDGLVDPELFLLDLGFIEAWESTTAPAPQSASRRRLIAA